MNERNIVKFKIILCSMVALGLPVYIVSGERIELNRQQLKKAYALAAKVESELKKMRTELLSDRSKIDVVFTKNLSSEQAQLAVQPYVTKYRLWREKVRSLIGECRTYGEYVKHSIDGLNGFYDELYVAQRYISNRLKTSAAEPLGIDKKQSTERILSLKKEAQKTELADFSGQSTSSVVPVFRPIVATEMMPDEPLVHVGQYEQPDEDVYRETEAGTSAHFLQESAQQRHKAASEVSEKLKFSELPEDPFFKLKSLPEVYDWLQRIMSDQGTSLTQSVATEEKYVEVGGMLRDLYNKYEQMQEQLLQYYDQKAEMFTGRALSKLGAGMQRDNRLLGLVSNFIDGLRVFANLLVENQGKIISQIIAHHDKPKNDFDSNYNYIRSLFESGPKGYVVAKDAKKINDYFDALIKLQNDVSKSGYPTLKTSFKHDYQLLYRILQRFGRWNDNFGKGLERLLSYYDKKS